MEMTEARAARLMLTCVNPLCANTSSNQVSTRSNTSLWGVNHCDGVQIRNDSHKFKCLVENLKERKFVSSTR